MKSFNEAAKKHLPTLEQYVPIVAKVHGGTHPEFHEVKKMFDAIAKNIKSAVADKPALDEEFSKLREITNNYTIPNDVCESYEAVYNMLSEIDAAYFA